MPTWSNVCEMHCSATAHRFFTGRRKNVSSGKELVSRVDPRARRGCGHGGGRAHPGGLGKVTPLRYELKEIGRFVAPTHVTAPPGDTRRLFVVEKAGRIRVVLDGRVLARPFLDLTALVKSDGGEQGLLSLAFAPDYATSGNFYVYYVDRDENARVVEYRRSAASANRADPATRREVLLVPGFGEHYGGLLLFGPDGVLHLGVGDGGLEQNRDPLRAQRDGELHGKILSVDPTTGATEAWVKGLRNPWRYWVDATTQDLWVGDVGEYVRESIDYVPGPNVAGANLGWPCFEGAARETGVPPSCVRARVRRCSTTRARGATARSSPASSSGTHAYRRSPAASSTQTSASAR